MATRVFQALRTGEFCDSSCGIDLAFFAGAHVAQGRLRVACEDQRVAGSEAVGLLHLALDRTAGKVDIGADPSPAKPGDQGESPIATTLLGDDEDAVALVIRGPSRRVPLRLQRQGDSVHSPCPTAG